MFFEHRTLTLAKTTRRSGEHQDASAVDAARGIAAITDGVSSTLFAGRGYGSKADWLPEATVLRQRNNASNCGSIRSTGTESPMGRASDAQNHHGHP